MSDKKCSCLQADLFVSIEGYSCEWTFSCIYELVVKCCYTLIPVLNPFVTSFIQSENIVKIDKYGNLEQWICGGLDRQQEKRHKVVSGEGKKNEEGPM